MVPEPDVQTVFEDIKSGAAPNRARDRGLTVRHLQPFFDPSIWSGFDDSQDVRQQTVPLFTQVTELRRRGLGLLYYLPQPLRAPRS